MSVKLLAQTLRKRLKMSAQLQYKVMERRMAYVRLANAELIKASLKKEIGEPVIVKACRRFLKTSLPIMLNAEIKASE